jgi:hypothetical protein
VTNCAGCSKGDRTLLGQAFDDSVHELKRGQECRGDDFATEVFKSITNALRADSPGEQIPGSLTCSAVVTLISPRASGVSVASFQNP